MEALKLNLNNQSLAPSLTYNNVPNSNHNNIKFLNHHHQVYRILAASNSTSTFYERNQSWIHGLSIAYGIHMLIGFLLFEYAWYRMQRMRDINEERDSKFPVFRRMDVKRWSRWKFYPGAMLTMPARMALLFTMGVVQTLICV